MKILSAAFSDDPCDVADLAVFVISDDDKKRLNKYWGLFRMVLERDGQISELAFWDEFDDGQFIENTPVGTNPLTANYQVVPDSFLFTDGDHIRTISESDRLVFTQEGFYWEAQVKHCSVRLKTAILPYSLIE